MLVSMTAMKRLLIIAFLLAAPAYAVTVDRIAAVIDRQVLTVSEVNQMAELRFFPRVAGRSEDDYRHDILEALIAQAGHKDLGEHAQRGLRRLHESRAISANVDSDHYVCAEVPGVTNRKVRHQSGDIVLHKRRHASE